MSYNNDGFDLLSNEFKEAADSGELDEDIDRGMSLDRAFTRYKARKERAENEAKIADLERKIQEARKAQAQKSKARSTVPKNSGERLERAKARVSQMRQNQAAPPILESSPPLSYAERVERAEALVRQMRQGKH